MSREVKGKEIDIKKDEYYMGQALLEARKAYDQLEVPIGAVVVLEGEIIGRGFNRVESLKSPLAHAEIVAINQASKRIGAWRLLGSSIYVTLEPCAMCAGAIVNSRISRVVIGAMDTKRGCAGSTMDVFSNSDLNHKVIKDTGILEDESRGMIQSFFKKLREKKKNI